MNLLDSLSCLVLPMKWHKYSTTNSFLSLDFDILLIPASTSTDWKERSNKQDANKLSYSIELLKMDSNRRSDPSSSGIVDDSFAAEIDHMLPLFPPTLMNLKNRFPLCHRKRLMRCTPNHSPTTSTTDSYPYSIHSLFLSYDSRTTFRFKRKSDYRWRRRRLSERRTNKKLSQCKWRTYSYSLSRRTERRTQRFRPLKSLESFWLKRG